MTENDGERVYASQIALPDGSTWGAQEVMDLRAEFVELKADNTRLLDTLKQRNENVEQYRERASRNQSALLDFQRKVQSTLHELVDEDNLDVEVANEVLDDLGLDKVPLEYAFTVNVTIHGTCKTTSEDDLESALAEASIDFDTTYTDVESVEVTATDIESVEVERA